MNKKTIANKTGLYSDIPLAIQYLRHAITAQERLQSLPVSDRKNYHYDPVMLRAWQQRLQVWEKTLLKH